MRNFRHVLGGAVVAAAVGVGLAFMTATTAQAMPSFSRQTGMSCNQCHILHTPVPDFTITGMKFRSLGYRIPERQTKLRAGKPGSQGEELDIPWWDYLSFRFQSTLLQRSKTPGGQTSELSSAASRRFAFFITGPVTEHIGFWNEFYFVPYGSSQHNWAPSLASWDEYDLVWTLDPNAIQNNGNVYSLRLTNQSVNETDGFGPGPIYVGGGALEFRNEQFGAIHPPTVSYRLTAWMHDRYVWQLGLNSGDNNTGWNQKNVEADFAYFLKNTNGNTMALRIDGTYGNDMTPLVTKIHLNNGPNQNPLDYSYNDAIAGVSATRGAGMGPYMNTDMDHTMTVNPEFRWIRSDFGTGGANTYMLVVRYSYTNEKYNDSAGTKLNTFGAYIQYCYLHTYCAAPYYLHTLKYEFTDHTGVVYDIDTPDKYGVDLTYQPAMNFAVDLSLSNTYRQHLTGPATTGGYSASLYLDFAF